MTKNKIKPTIKQVIHCLKAGSERYHELCEECQLYGEVGCDHCYDDVTDMAIKALEEREQYRAIGTIKELKALKEVDMKEANRAVDEFANYLHRIAKENNGLRLSSEIRSWTHPCIFDYLEEFKNGQICKTEI